MGVWRLADRKTPDRKVARKPGDDGVGGQPVAKSVSEISVQKMAQILHTLARGCCSLREHSTSRPPKWEWW